jgi:AraC-like DNA-binding protein
MPLKAVVESPWNAAGTALLTLIVAGRLIGLRETGLFAAAAPVVAAAGAGLGTLPAPGSAPDAAPDPVKADESRQLATLARLMTAERIYREPSLTIAALAHRMGLPEHRLRRLINRSLGHRNFNAYLNGHRIADIQRALRDPAQAATPVLTIAMDAGFQSLGPFNRAFKAATGLTPTEFRRGGAAGAEPAAALPPAETESA